jgi:hypothetical protein
MIKIVATADQIRQMQQSNEAVEFVDAEGNRLGLIARACDLEDIRIARARLESDEERLPYSAVLAHLASLDPAQ